MDTASETGGGQEEDPGSAPLDPLENLLPPADANDWTDEQWIAWLAATDAEETEGSGSDEHTEPTVTQKITGSIGGQLLAGGMLGVANAIYGKQNEQIGVVQPAGDAEDDDDPFVVHLDPEFPERSVAIIRTGRHAPDHPSVGTDTPLES